MIALIKFWCWIGLIVFGFCSLYAFKNLHRDGQVEITAEGPMVVTAYQGLFYSILRFAICASIIYFL